MPPYAMVPLSVGGREWTSINLEGVLIDLIIISNYTYVLIV